MSDDGAAGGPAGDATGTRADATVEAEAEDEAGEMVRSRDEQAPDAAELHARLETLEAENERLRATIVAAQRRRYRLTALGLGTVGMVALGGAVVIPELRELLVALAATGIFGAVLTYVLTPERFVAASVGERVYGTLADNERAIVDDLDLRGEPVVVPTAGELGPARLYVPLSSRDVGTADGAGTGAGTIPASVPEEEALATPFVTTGGAGLAVKPTGGPLYESLVAATGALPEGPANVGVVVADGLVEQFELVGEAEVDAEPGRVTLAVDDSAYGPVDRFDHPVASLLATALAVTLETPVSVSVAEGGEDGEWLVTCRWDPDARASEA